MRTLPRRVAGHAVRQDTGIQSGASSFRLAFNAPSLSTPPPWQLLRKASAQKALSNFCSTNRQLNQLDQPGDQASKEARREDGRCTENRRHLQTEQTNPSTQRKKGRASQVQRNTDKNSQIRKQTDGKLPEHCTEHLRSPWQLHTKRSKPRKAAHIPKIEALRN